MACLKQISYLGSAHTHKHLHKFRTGNGEKTEPLPHRQLPWQEGSYRFQEGLQEGRLLAWKHRSLCTSQDCEGNPRSQFKRLFLLHLHLPHLLKSNSCFFLDVHLGVALAYAHNSAAAHTLHGKVHNKQQEQEWKCIT